MKKSLILVGMLAIGYANAQQGNVGINTETPKATLEVLPSKTNLEGTTNEGIIIPKLTKERIANIADTNLVEGTLVYATDVTYTGTNAKVVKIDEKGYYYYDGTEWLKVQHTDTNTDLWAQRDNNGVVEVYLVQADDNDEEYSYSKNRAILTLGKNENKYVGGDGAKVDGLKGKVPHYISINGSALTKENTTQGPFGSYYPIFSIEDYLVDDTFVPTTTVTPKMRGKDIILNAKNLKIPISYIIGQNVSSDFQSSTYVEQVNSFRAFTNVGDIDNKTSPNVKNVMGSSHMSNLYSGKVENLYGMNVNTLKYGGEVDTIYGISNTLNTSAQMPNQTNYITQSLKNVSAYHSILRNMPNTTAERIYNILAYTNFENASNVIDEAATVFAHANIKRGSNLRRLSLVNAYAIGEDGVNVQDLYAFRFVNSLQANFKPSNMYGMYLADVNKGSNTNYAIYTNEGKIRFGDNVGIGVNNPNEKLEVSGKIKATNVIFTNIPTYANDTSAGAGGLVAGEMYKTATGELRIKL